jgi:16S rRNA (cytosine967-C5)-methyltransferase
MLDVQRQAAQAVGEVLAGRSLDAALEASWRRRPGLEPPQRAAIQDIAYGTLRHLTRVEALLDALLERPLRDARLRALLLVALYQLEATRAAPHAVVDHAVRASEAVGLTSARGLVNAVLRRFLRERPALSARVERDETVRYGHPRWWIEHLRQQYPRHYPAMLAAGNARPPLTLRVNRRRTTVEAYRQRLEREGIGSMPCGADGLMLIKPLPAHRIAGLAEGDVSVQDAAAQFAAHWLDVADGQRVLDACAAPGGKTGHILELAAAELTALDSDAARLERVRDNLQRLGLAARLVCGDACRPDAWWDGREFHRILLDAPCSASGVTRRHPDIKWLRREADIASFSRTQSAMLEALWQTLASGGKLLYATCSVFREENAAQVARFLERHRDALRLTLQAVNDDPELPAGQMLPDERHDGFFYALLQKA